MALTLHESQSPLRWLVLIFGCLVLIGNYYCYDNPAALKTQLEESTKLSEFMFNMLYSVYSFPNMFLPFVGACAARPTPPNLSSPPTTLRAQAAGGEVRGVRVKPERARTHQQ